ncbi:MAG: DUF2905 domain-containing protein [Bacteroidota bacterium]|nr:DUF2905 domain-containing protein [Bacteroidota bacterium]
MSRDLAYFLRLTIAIAVLTAIVTLARAYFGGIPYLGSLPGDLSIPVGGAEIYFPLGSGVIISFVLLSLGHFTGGKSHHRLIE